MTVWFLALSCAFLVSSELAGVLVASRAEPLGALSSCGEVRHELVRRTSTGDAPDLNDGPLVRRVFLPSNLETASVFQPFLDKMWQASPTFRDQSRRLAAGTGLHVSVLVEDLPRPASSSKARTVLTHQNGSLVSAHVYLKPTLDAAELIAHELEHILEQLDGVDLRAQAGNGVVWKAGDGDFETRRAIEAGRRVAREITTGSDVTDVRHLPHENHAHRLTTVVQRDRNATPSSVRSARVSGSGRYVVFVSSAQPVEAGRNQLGDVYVLDLATGECTLESVGPGGSPGNGESLSPDISRDGRYVVFESAAGNLLDTPVPPGIFRVLLRDREKGVTRLLSANANGEAANGTSGNPAISADGTVVVFESTATDLVESGDAARSSVGIYLIRLTSGLRTRLDLTSAGGRRVGQSMSPAISADGRFVAFVSKADLMCGEASTCVTEPSHKKGVADVYLRDTHTNTTRRVTSSYAGGDPNGPSYHPAISADGRHVAFVSEASNLTRDSTSRTAHIYVHDLGTGITELVSRTPSGRPANGPSLRPALSQDGATVAFQSLANNLVCEGKCQGGQPDINLVWDVFVYDRFARRAARVSTDIGEEWMENSRAPSLDDAGQVLAFGSRHPINGRDEADDENLYVYRLPAPATRGEPLTIVLHVDDYAAVPRKLLLRAEVRAMTLYSSVGVETLWVNRAMPGELHSEGSALAGPVSFQAVHLRVIILSDEMTRRKLRDSLHGSDVIGLAQAAPELSNTVAFVFFARLERAADRYVKSTSDVLGHVMAHEVGHLILQHGRHSDTGIMRDAWEPNEIRTPVFTAEQAAMIRAKLSAAGASELK